MLHVRETPYTVREARIHVRHVRDLLKSLESTDSYNGTECSSLSFLNTVTQGDIIGRDRLLYITFMLRCYSVELGKELCPNSLTCLHLEPDKNVCSTFIKYILLIFCNRSLSKNVSHDGLLKFDMAYMNFLQKKVICGFIPHYSSCCALPNCTLSF